MELCKMEKHEWYLATFGELNYGYTGGEQYIYFKLAKDDKVAVLLRTLGIIMSIKNAKTIIIPLKDTCGNYIIAKNSVYIEDRFNACRK